MPRKLTASFWSILILGGLLAMPLGVSQNCSAKACPSPQFGPRRHIEVRDPISIAAGQECPMFCWAASVQMVAKAQGINLPQDVVAAKVFGLPLRCRPSGDIAHIVQGIRGVYKRDDGATVALQARAFVGNNGYAVPLINAIHDNRPFIFLTQTHAMVAVGVTWSDVFDQSGRQIGVQIWEINLIDPFFTFGAQEFVTFPIRPDTANQISGCIEIISIKLTR
jgi:hypothetical protein